MPRPGSSWPRRPGSTSPPTRHASAISGSATPTARRTGRRRHGRRSTPTGGRRPMMTAPEAPPTTEQPTTTSEATAHAVAFVAAHRDAAEALGAALAEFTNDPDGFAAALTAGPGRPRRPGVPGRPTARRPRHRRGPRRPLAVARRRPARVPERLEGRARHAPPVHRRPPLPRARARSALVRLRPPRTDPRHRDRAHLAADAPSRPRGRRLDHRRFAGPPVRQGHRRGDLPLGRARAARLQPVSLGAPAHRLDHRDDDPRRPQARPRSRGRRPRPAAARGR